jgi:hypothetical protein
MGLVNEVFTTAHTTGDNAALQERHFLQNAGNAGKSKVSRNEVAKPTYISGLT